MFLFVCLLFSAIIFSIKSNGLGWQHADDN